MSLRDLLRERASIQQLAAHLDALPADVCAFQANGLSPREQAQLFEAAADSEPIRNSHFVPAELPTRVAVHHPGYNTVLTIPYFKRFEKRFMKASEPEHEGKLAGYNHSNAFFIRPGYFVAFETDGVHAPEAKRSEWSRRGGVVVDYFQVPTGWAVAEGWPAVVPNSVGLQRFVYFKTRDFMRRVSRNVSVGRAATEDGKGDRMLDYWFTLVRQDPRPAGLLR